MEISVSYEDKAVGMLMMGAFGDALGAPLERHGLRGDTTPVSAVRPLRPFDQVVGDDGVGNPWFVWTAPTEPDRRGIVTDDTAYRVTLLHPWLASLGTAHEAQESAHRRFMLRQVERGLHSVPQGEMILGWDAMWSDAARWQDERMATPPVAAEAFEPSPENRFFHPAYPVVFGLFLYLERAFTIPPSEAWQRGREATLLDIGYGRQVTALFFALLSRAVEERSAIAFDAWLIREAESALADARMEPGVEPVWHAVRRAHSVGVDLRDEGVPDDTAAAMMKELFYDARPPDGGTGLGTFDPLLFVEMIVTAATYARDDAERALVLLAAGAGDSDTMTSMLGSLWGAWSGTRIVPGAAFEQVLPYVEETFGCSFSDLAEMLARRREQALAIAATA